MQSNTPPDDAVTSRSAPVQISTTPTSPGNDDLARRCRALARSVGHASVQEHKSHDLFFDIGGNGNSPGSSSSPHRSPRLNLAPLSPLHAPPLSPRSAGSMYPTPEGSLILGGIAEDELFDPLQPSSVSLSSARASRRSSWQHHHHNHASTHQSPVKAQPSIFDAFQSPSETSFDEALMRSSLKDGGVSHFEIDVWLVEGELLVGPDQTALSPDHTLSSMYLDPLLNIFQAHQPSTPSSLGDYTTPSHQLRRRSSTTTVHRNYSQLPLLLLLNLRTSPTMTFQFLLHFLRPLFDASILTTYCPNADSITPGLVTVACSLSASTEQLAPDILHQAPRFVFGAADLHDGDESQWHKELTPVVNGELVRLIGADQFESELDSEQIERIKDLVARVHKKGMRLRLAGVTKGSPAAQSLTEIGVDYI